MGEPVADYPRGRDVSTALTEVRTVLSRAEAALRRLSEPTEYHKLPECRYDFDRPKYEDPDAQDMRLALDQVIDLLDRWRRTGRTAR